MAKVTMQDIADALNISRVTVWKVFNNHSGVSDDLRMQIINKAKELGYTKWKPTEYIENNIIAERTVSVIVSRPESAVFWTSIIHQLAKELTTFNVNLMYTYVPSSYSEGYSLPNILSNGTVQGVVVLNIYDSKMIRLINQLTLPKVFLDNVPEVYNEELSGDVILLEGYSSTKKITNFIIHKGRTDIGFIGDIRYAQTNLDRYNGFLAAMKENDLIVSPNNCLIRSLGIYSYYEEMCHFLDKLEKMPSAFVCVSDYVAHFLYKYLCERGYHVPGDVAISGYDGSPEYTAIKNIITTVNVQTSDLGRRLARQILYRIDFPDVSHELTYISSEIVFRETTDF
ncbi:MAG TPA: LacI family DNA-binding transcriptional regulator [Lachnospiraceae bacterium]|nr:LacI family DNA-binding transcriptional regulator [Lachnospiraceae bacterium]